MIALKWAALERLLELQQLAWLAAGVVIFVVVALSDSRIFDRMAYVLYAERGAYLTVGTRAAMGPS